MNLSGIHLLWTYQCTFECEHCFAWGSPWQTGTMTLEKLGDILGQAEELGTVEWVYFEGGEPFLYYKTLLSGAQLAADRGFRVGIVTNAYWAVDENDALECLKPFQYFLDDLAVSSDLYHSDEKTSKESEVALKAAEELGIPAGVITIARPEAAGARRVEGQIPAGETGVMYRGRAAEKLVSQTPKRRWEELTECPHEDLREPERVHVDPMGNVHICQGLVIGNLFDKPLIEICEGYDPKGHPVIGPLIEGGPAALVRRYGLPHEDEYADACHFCYDVRRALRARFPEVLTPDQMYGVMEKNRDPGVHE
jgi:MoaA/NifB/PqqE/SkfB family radical SAM enzyme